MKLHQTTSSLSPGLLKHGLMAFGFRQCSDSARVQVNMQALQISRVVISAIGACLISVQRLMQSSGC